MCVQESICVKCPIKNYKRGECARVKHKYDGKGCPVFKDAYGAPSDTAKVAFLKQCLPDAIAKDGTVKSEYHCTGKDAEKAEGEVAAF